MSAPKCFRCNLCGEGISDISKYLFFNFPPFNRFFCHPHDATLPNTPDAFVEEDCCCGGLLYLDNFSNSLLSPPNWSSTFKQNWGRNGSFRRKIINWIRRLSISKTPHCECSATECNSSLFHQYRLDVGEVHNQIVLMNSADLVELLMIDNQTPGVDTINSGMEKSSSTCISIEKLARVQTLLFLVIHAMQIMNENELTDIDSETSGAQSDAEGIDGLKIISSIGGGYSTVRQSERHDKRRKLVKCKGSSFSEEITKKCCSIQEIEVVYKNVLIAGWYRKYSREISHSKWIVNDRMKVPFSVEQMVGIPFKALLGARSYKFMSAGREDLDVRMLGGRPFLLELTDTQYSAAEWPKLVDALGSATPVKLSEGLEEDYAIRICVDEEELMAFNSANFLSADRRALENIFNDKIELRPKCFNRITQAVSVEIPRWKFAECSRSCHLALQSAAEGKRKNYDCLVFCYEAVAREALEVAQRSLKQDLPFQISQGTPIRVQHRRTIDYRQRWIYSAQLQWISEHLFIVRLETQAGTYIKEFVHSDCGRTYPNLASYFHRELEVVALDVTHLTF